MPKAATATFANLVCRFGDKFVLLDLATQIVIPAFMDREIKRQYAHTTYFFWDVGTITAPSEDPDSPILALYGRLVKDTSLKRQQQFVDGVGLVAGEEELPSAPSSFFTLILNDHKLIYVGETDEAPLIGQFQATLQHNVSVKYREYINSLYQELRDSAQPKTKKQLYQEIPHPTVEIRPLASRASVEEFLTRFATVKHVEFRILDTNQEFPMLETHRRLREMKRLLDAKLTTLSHDNPAGLDKANVTEQIHTASAAGNEAVRISGISREGDVLRGNNEDFIVEVPLDRLPEEDAERAAHLVHLYQEHAQGGILIEDVRPDVREKLRRLIGLFRRNPHE